MEKTFCGICIIIFVSKVLPSAAGRVNGLDIKNGTFQILQQHPQLKKCADSVLFENEYVGCRVSERTGQCQALTHSWGLNHTIEQGYAYAKKLFLQENFLPPFDLGPIVQKVPVVLNTGSQIDIYMSIPNWSLFTIHDEIFVMELLNVYDSDVYSERHYVSCRFFNEYTDIHEYVGREGGHTITMGQIRGNRLSAPASSKGMFKISLLALSDALAMFVEEEEVATLKLTTHIRKMKEIIIDRSDYTLPEYPRFVHGIKFTGK